MFYSLNKYWISLEGGFVFYILCLSGIPYVNLFYKVSEHGNVIRFLSVQKDHFKVIVIFEYKVSVPILSDIDKNSFSLVH